MRINGSQIVKIPASVLIGSEPFDVDDPRQARSTSTLGGLGGTGDEQSFTETEFLDQGSRDIRVGRLGDIMAFGITKEAESFGMQLQDALKNRCFESHAILRDTTVT
jgi:hypothetical protein